VLHHAMKQSKRQSWERVRARGRGPFLAHSIIRAAWIFALVMVPLELALSFLGHHVVVWEAVVRWAFFSVGAGGGLGFMTWQENEARYLEKECHEDPH
jgi:hypothetical protein